MARRGVKPTAISTFALLAFSACVALPPPIHMASQAEIETQQRAATAQTMGYPTRKSPEDLATLIQKQTKDFKSAGKLAPVRLEAPAPIKIEGVRGTCYTVVMHLADGATWGLGAEAGLRFDFVGPSRQGSGGPGVQGPGAVASVGCAEATGPITLIMAPLVGRDPIGQGAMELELFSHVLTRAEAEHLEADKQQQIAEQREFRAREDAKKQQRLSGGCAKCDARYQGCIGSGRGETTCQASYRSCAFEEAGPDYLSACPSAR